MLNHRDISQDTKILTLLPCHFCFRSLCHFLSKSHQKRSAPTIHHIWWYVESKSFKGFKAGLRRFLFIFWLPRFLDVVISSISRWQLKLIKKSIEYARQDTDFESIRNEKRFKALIIEGNKNTLVSLKNKKLAIQQALLLDLSYNNLWLTFFSYWLHFSLILSILLWYICPLWLNALGFNLQPLSLIPPRIVGFPISTREQYSPNFFKDYL